MNQRVKELYEQAQDWADNQNFFASEYYDYMMEKFAELIVRECIEQVEVFNVRMDARPRHIVEAIKSHFGVEE